jgi:hypothetical protein
MTGRIDVAVDLEEAADALPSLNFVVVDGVVVGWPTQTGNAQDFELAAKKKPPKKTAKGDYTRVDQPRVPAGNRKGGEFTTKGAAAVGGIGPLTGAKKPSRATLAAIEKAIAQRQSIGGSHVQYAIHEVLGEGARIQAKRWEHSWVNAPTPARAAEAASAVNTRGSWQHVQYHATQAELRHRLPELQRRGIVDEHGYVTLYRGVHGPQAEKLLAHFAAHGDDSEAMLDTNKLASWSDNPQVGQLFAESSPGLKGVVVTQRVHYSRAFWSYHGEFQTIENNDDYEWMALHDGPAPVRLHARADED